MNTYYLRMRFQYRINSDLGIMLQTGWTERWVRTTAESILAASQDAEHIINGYRLGSGLEAECDKVQSTPPKGSGWIEGRREFTGPITGENDNG